MHYLEALARRACAHRGDVRRILDERLFRGVADLRLRFERAQADAKCSFDPEEIARASTLGDLVRYLAQHTPEHRAGVADGNAGSTTELKSVRYFRNTWSKLSADKQLAKALDQAPKNAGPINSHMLVLRSLALMREISPDYLNRFMAYADTLLYLDQCNSEKPAVAKEGAAGAAVKKPKAVRTRSR
jgi:hypothetical protein